jgi:ribonucleoside-triphosphate reductase
MENKETIGLEEISKFIFISKYARYNEKLKRRETWEEAASRVEEMHLKKYSFLSKDDKDKIKWAFDLVRDKYVVPSMRGMQFGGKAIEAHNSRQFNCAVRHVDSLRSFSEIFYLLLCGCGVGIGLSKYFLNRLPDLVKENDKTGTIITYVVEDDIEGWADSIEALLMCYFHNTPYTGRKIVFDYSRIRPEGSPLKTGGGKAPGHKGLKNCHIRIKELLDHAVEYKKCSRLKSIDAYDTIMHCGDAVLSGGVRRTATSVIFDKDDEEMMNAKTYLKVDKVFNFYYLEDRTIGGKTYKYYEGKVNYEGKRYEIQVAEYELSKIKDESLVFFKHIHPQRGRSNNSVLLLRENTTLDEFKKIIEKTKQFGEPGFVWGNHPWQLFNPCFEIGFIPVTEDGICGVQFCNLTSQNGAKIKNKKTWYDCVESAVIIGTLQAGYTNFPYLSKTSEDLTKEEALLGVSITGIMDNPDLLLNPEIQLEMAKYSIKINEIWADKLKINKASRITCIKPEGTGSLALGAASGIHPRHSRRFIRRVQVNYMESPYKLFKSSNSHACEKSVWDASKKDEIISFPIIVPKESMVKDDLTTMKHLKYIKSTQQNWVMGGVSPSNKKNISHNVSCTITMKDNEWNDIVSYIYDNRNFFAAISMVPSNSDKSYPQAPNESIVSQKDEEHFDDLLNRFKSIDYSLLKEEDDNTSHTQESSCSGGMCEIV